MIIIRYFVGDKFKDGREQNYQDCFSNEGEAVKWAKDLDPSIKIEDLDDIDFNSEILFGEVYTVKIYDEDQVDDLLKEDFDGYFFFSEQNDPRPSEIEILRIEDIFEMEYFKNYIEDYFNNKNEYHYIDLAYEIEDYVSEDDVYFCEYYKKDDLKENFGKFDKRLLEKKKEEVATFSEEEFEGYLYKFDYFGNVANIINRKFELEIICVDDNEISDKELEGYKDFNSLSDEEKLDVRKELSI